MHVMLYEVLMHTVYIYFIYMYIYICLTGVGGVNLDEHESKNLFNLIWKGGGRHAYLLEAVSMWE